MLHLHHDLGSIIYFEGNNKQNNSLRDIVIIDPQWLINVFKGVITVRPNAKQVQQILVAANILL